MLTERYLAPLPLVAYVAGAAIAVAMSFAFVILRNPVPAQPPRDRATVRLPALVRHGLRLAGVVAWVWIVAQAVVGGSGEADVASLFL